MTKLSSTYMVPKAESSIISMHKLATTELTGLPMAHSPTTNWHSRGFACKYNRCIQNSLLKGQISRER